MIVVCIAVLLAAFEIQISKQDDCHWRRLDLCSLTALPMIQRSPVPQTEQDMDKQCSYFAESNGCFNNYTEKCMTPLQRDTFSFAREEIEKNMNMFCTPGSEVRKSFLKHAPCLGEAWRQQMSCINDAQAALETLREADFSKRIIITCCAYQRFRQCGIDIMKNKCGDETLQFVSQLITLYMYDMPYIVCSNYNYNDTKCTEALPAPRTLPRGTEYISFVARFIRTITRN